MTLHEYIAKRRIKGRFTQRDFAREADISDAHLSDILKGKRHIGAKVARKINAATGGKVKLETLLFGDR